MQTVGHTKRFPLIGVARVLLLSAALSATHLMAQDYTPVHIVGMPYPAEARDLRVQGVVKLECILNSDGSVAEIKVLLGHPIFLKAVLENARQWRFAAGGKASSSGMRALLSYEFKLTDPVCDSHYKEQFVFDEPGRVLITSQYPCWRSSGIEKRQ